MDEINNIYNIHNLAYGQENHMWDCWNNYDQEMLKVPHNFESIYQGSLNLEKVKIKRNLMSMSSQKGNLHNLKIN